MAGLVLATAAAGVGGVGASTWLLWVLLVPLLEETVFRLGLQDALLRQGLPPWLANTCTALCFTACHVLLRGAGWASWAVLGPALLLGVVYGRSRQLRGCVALHALMNAGWIAAQQLAPG
ncbi:MAG: JDVT-CTERM system glutamic-type intramembrane protease [Pseudomonadota bacterium]